MSLKIAQQLLKIIARILAAAIAMMQKTRRRHPRLDRHLLCCDHYLRVNAFTHRPANDTTTEQVHHRCQVEIVPEPVVGYRQLMP